jgi:hypothetical protein
MAGAVSPVVDEAVPRSWAEIPDMLGVDPTRGARKPVQRQCKERFRQYLDPSLNKGPWTEEEDQTLLLLYTRLGKRKKGRKEVIPWQSMMPYFEGRADEPIKDHLRWLVRHGVEIAPEIVAEVAELSVAELTPVALAAIIGKISVPQAAAPVQAPAPAQDPDDAAPRGEQEGTSVFDDLGDDPPVLLPEDEEEQIGWDLLQWG